MTEFPEGLIERIADNLTLSVIRAILRESGYVGLVAALKLIAKQHTRDEINSDPDVDPEDADWEGAYHSMIEDARDALRKAGAL